MLVEGVVRTIRADGQKLLFSETAADSWWTSLPCGVRECVKPCRSHGTGGQFHSELKCDMGIELFPSGGMKTNALIPGLVTLAFNCLRFIWQTVLAHAPVPRNEDKRTERCRLRTVLPYYIKVACRIVRHAGQTLLKFGRNCYNFLIMKKIYETC